jgi:hypothetical protein
MTNEHNLEQRLRSGLQQAAPGSVVDRPGVDELASVVAGRKRRNKVAGVAFAAVGGLAIVGGGLLAALPDDSPSEVVLAAPEEDTSTARPAAAEPSTDEAVDAAPQDAAVDDAAAPTEEKAAAAEAPLVSAPVEETIENAPLQADADGISVETQASAVDFAGGSGVLLVPSADGFAGLASRFGGAAGISAIGLTSTDGLAWTEVDLDGVPAGATATALRAYDGTYVALFSLFDVDAQRNNTFVGVSTDLASWSLAPALPGRDAIATDLAVGPAGVMVVGVAPEPRVWVGPLGGPYELGDPVDASTLAGVVAIDAGFVAVGTTPDGPTLFDSTDGTAWTSSLMSGFDGDSVVSFSVLDGSILLAGDDGATTWTAMSADGGQSWQRSELEAGTVGSVSTGAGTVGFLGNSALGANTLTLSDGDSWASTSIDVAAPDRVQLLVAGGDAAVLLANVNGELTWIRASR